MNVSDFPKNVVLIVGDRGGGKSKYLDYIGRARRAAYMPVISTEWFNYTLNALDGTLAEWDPMKYPLILVDDAESNQRKLRELKMLAEKYPEVFFIATVNKTDLS